MIDRDELDDFLDNFVPSPTLRHATLFQYLNDPITRGRVLDDGDGTSPLIRTVLSDGVKLMDESELRARSYQFFEDNHATWSAHFRDFVLDRDVPAAKLETFIESFATIWVDGRKCRQFSAPMLAIKASIRDLDRVRYPRSAGRFVIHQIDEGIEPLLSPSEIAAIFEANAGLINALLPDYLDALGANSPGSLGSLYVRRGAFTDQVESIRRELHYLSSFSLALGPVEQFAQTGARNKKATGVPSIFSAPVAAIQDRLVAFAPFIEGMSLAQLEFVVAPPIIETPFYSHGIHGGIYEFTFS